MKMSRLFFSSLLMSAAQLLFAAAPGDTPKQTEVVVIGTVHNATPNYGKEQLVAILQRVNPAAVLFETDSSFFDKDVPQLLPQYRTSGLESEAVVAFQQGTQVPVIPYDIEGRNKIYQEHAYFERQSGFSQAVGTLHREKLLSPEAERMLQEVMATGNMLAAFGQDRPDAINSSGCDAAVAHKHQADATVGAIIALTPALSQFAEYAKFNDEFWAQRNETMVTNIVNQTKKFSGKRVAVLCGFEHRYYLMRLLKALDEKSGISVREYWSYQ
jgi:hypothetical protein